MRPLTGAAGRLVVGSRMLSFCRGREGLLDKGLGCSRVITTRSADPAASFVCVLVLVYPCIDMSGGKVATRRKDRCGVN